MSCDRYCSYGNEPVEVQWRRTSPNFKTECVKIRHWLRMFIFLDPPLLSGLGTGKMHLMYISAELKLLNMQEIQHCQTFHSRSPGKLLLATMLQFICQTLSRFPGSLRGVIAKTFEFLVSRQCLLSSPLDMSWTIILIYSPANVVFLLYNRWTTA